MPYPAKSVANAFLNKTFQNSKKIDPMKLQKLIYYACDHYIAVYSEPLIDYTFQAWKYGPVLPVIYD